MLRTPKGDMLNLDLGPGGWLHPWTLDVVWEADQFAPDGEWRAYVIPGLVNGRDVYIDTPVVNEEDGSIEKVPVALTANSAPWISLTNWRNPLASAGVTASADGDLRVLPGEGYPEIFNELGVRPPANGGDITDPNANTGEDVPTRTRQIRAIDVILTQPRVSVSIDPTTAGVAGTPFQLIGTRFTTPSDTRPMMRSTSKFTPPKEDDTLEAVFGLLLQDGDPPFDQILMGTVWILSPPDAPDDEEPNASWEPYAQHFVFWNLKWASNLVLEETVSDPITLQIPLAGGVASPVVDFLVSGINQMLEEVRAFLAKAKAKGIFWT